MDLEAAARLIRDVGFPVFVGAYVLIRIEPILRQLTVMVSRLTVLIEDRAARGGL